MSASHAPALDAIGFQLVAALETYEADVARMLASWPDFEAYRTVSEQVEKIRMYCSTLPLVRVHWVELLIAHAELIHVLWRVQYANREDALGQVAAVRERHADCVVALRNRCLRAIAQSRPKFA